jgi:hypothetical protein
MVSHAEDLDLAEAAAGEATGERGWSIAEFAAILGRPP